MTKRIGDSKYLVGQYIISGLNVNLFWRNGNGGEFQFRPGKGQLPAITIGIDEYRWDGLVSVLVHEALEFAMTDASLRYERNDDCGNSADGYTFIMTHPQFSDVCGRISGFLCETVPELAKIWKLNKKAKDSK